jgi:hypothetical protein
MSAQNCCSRMYCAGFGACQCQSMRLGVRMLGGWRIGLLGALGALAGALVLLATRRYGINVSPDSTYYRLSDLDRATWSGVPEGGRPVTP